MTMIFRIIIIIRWVHCETLVATLMAYQHTDNTEHYNNFRRIFDYTFEKVKDT